ncbi:hypothetical protein BDQ17DRAFT_1340301 [Cyathus striatus]|nr:hypothetical protein BDQ17DRAFT_1340301 [Cyathus striatus]
MASVPYSLPDHSSLHYPPPEHDIKRILANAANALDQSPPPSLREILGAYRAKGDGDRDMLLAMLNAKAAEDQRLASLASLHRSILEVYQQNAETPAQQHHAVNGNYHYPTPSFTQSPRPCDQRPSRRSYQYRHPRADSRSRSPPRTLPHASSARDPHMQYHNDHPRKRHRSSHSPHPSHSLISESAEYSPRARASMAIGSLLSSSAPRREVNGDSLSQERE